MGDPREIEIVGDDVSARVLGLRGRRQRRQPGGRPALVLARSRCFQKLFFRTPLVNLFIFGSEVYHDYYRWPMKDRKVFEQWRDGTPWGRLFQQYEGGAETP